MREKDIGNIEHFKLEIDLILILTYVDVNELHNVVVLYKTNC